ncbi:hypothetical protein L7F22_064206 [Adiantum nelumboides]|nr:hypothetical protein [Adiantum nelumboides]
MQLSLFEIAPAHAAELFQDGRPLYIEQLGKLDIKALYQVTTPERQLQKLVVEYEKFQRERLPVCTHERGELVETSCTIMDLKNVGVSQFWKVSSYVQQASNIGQHYYPETMGSFRPVRLTSSYSLRADTVSSFYIGKFYIVNAPYIFTYRLVCHQGLAGPRHGGEDQDSWLGLREGADGADSPREPATRTGGQVRLPRRRLLAVGRRAVEHRGREKDPRGGAQRGGPKARQPRNPSTQWQVMAPTPARASSALLFISLRPFFPDSPIQPSLDLCAR